MNKVYTPINWENYPSTKTELDAENLNTIDYAVNEMDNRIIEQDTSKANKTELSNLIKDWNMDESTGIITITKHNGSTIMFDLNIEKIPVSFSLSDDGILTMETDDGTKFTTNIGAMIPILTFNESDDIAVSVEGTGINKTYTFSLKNGAVTEEKLHPNYLANIKVEVANANAYSQAASNAAITSQSWAVGGTDSRENEDSNNAKYWAEQARTASGVGIASTSTAGKVLATNDVNVDSTGAMSIGTDFAVPEGLTNLVSGSDWNIILGQLAKLVEDYIDEKLNGYSTVGDVIAKSQSNPISMTGLKSAIETMDLNSRKAVTKYVTFTLSDISALNEAVQGLTGVKKVTAFMECFQKSMWCIGIWCVDSAASIGLIMPSNANLPMVTYYGFELYYDANNYEILKVMKDSNSDAISFAYQAKFGFAGDTTEARCVLLIEY